MRMTPGFWRLAADRSVQAGEGYAVYLFTADEDDTEAVVYIDKDINADIIENVTVHVRGRSWRL